MKITTNIDEINKILNEYNHEKARIWLFDIAHVRLAMKIYSNRNDEVMYLVLINCEYMGGPFSFNNPELCVNQFFDHNTSVTKFKVMDKKTDFKLISTGGITLAIGQEFEFGDSFEGFLKE
jgi:hypothetical protein